MPKLGFDERVAWERECRERKDAKRAETLQAAELDLIAAIGGGAFFALQRYLEVREAK